MVTRTRVEWHGDQIVRKVQEATADGLFDAVEYLLEESNRIVPLDEGTLMHSGQTSVDREKLTAALSYDTPYAAYLHEHPNFAFRNGRQGKWLQSTIQNYGQRAYQIVADRIRQAQ